MTPIEQAILDDFKRITGDEPDADFIREKTRETAYHEAGHAAMSVYLGYFDGHIHVVSIEPNGGSIGRVLMERCLPPINAYQHRCRGLFSLAGIAAGDLATETRTDLENLFYEFERDGEKDTSKAYESAEALSEDPFGTMETFYQDARKILQRPDVWATVERLAEILIERGKITAGAEYESIIDSIRWKGINPKGER